MPEDIHQRIGEEAAKRWTEHRLSGRPSTTPSLAEIIATVSREMWEKEQATLQRELTPEERSKISVEPILIGPGENYYGGTSDNE